MTEPWVATLIIVTIGLGMAWLARAYYRRTLADLIEHARARDEFFAITDQILDRKDTPEAIVDIIAVLSELARSRKVLHRLLYHLAFGHGTRGELRIEAARADVRRTLQKMPEDLRALYGQALIAWAIGLTYRHFVLGWFFRRIVLFSATARQTHHDGNGIDPNAAAVAAEGMRLAQAA